MPYAAHCAGRCSALRCPVQRTAFSEALVWVKCLAGSGKAFERAARLLPLPRRNPSSAALLSFRPFLVKQSKRPLRPFLSFGKSGPGILFIHFNPFGKSGQTFSPLVSFFWEKRPDVSTASSLAFEEGGRALGLPPFAPKSHDAHLPACSSAVGMKQDRAGHSCCVVCPARGIGVPCPVCAGRL